MLPLHFLQAQDPWQCADSLVPQHSVAPTLHPKEVLERLSHPVPSEAAHRPGRTRRSHPFQFPYHAGAFRQQLAAETRHGGDSHCADSEQEQPWFLTSTVEKQLVFRHSNKRKSSVLPATPPRTVQAALQSLGHSGCKRSTRKQSIYSR